MKKSTMKFTKMICALLAGGVALLVHFQVITLDDFLKIMGVFGAAFGTIYGVEARQIRAQEAGERDA